MLLPSVIGGSYVATETKQKGGGLGPHVVQVCVRWTIEGVDGFPFFLSMNKMR